MSNPYTKLKASSPVDLSRRFCSVRIKENWTSLQESPGQSKRSRSTTFGVQLNRRSITVFEKRFTNCDGDKCWSSPPRSSNFCLIQKTFISRLVPNRNGSICIQNLSGRTQGKNQYFFRKTVRMHDPAGFDAGFLLKKRVHKMTQGIHEFKKKNFFLSRMSLFL